MKEVIIIRLLWTVDTTVLWYTVDFPDLLALQIFPWDPTLVIRTVASGMFSLPAFQPPSPTSMPVLWLQSLRDLHSLRKSHICINLDFHVKFPILVINVVPLFSYLSSDWYRSSWIYWNFRGLEIYLVVFDGVHWWGMVSIFPVLSHFITLLIGQMRHRLVLWRSRLWDWV